MATYIPSVTDYIPSLQPFRPDYNFLANVLQTRQSNYDKNFSQLSSVYSSLFNSPMTRDDNNKTKDDFFKSIDQDIKKISGMDLSLQQNVDSANKVFQPFLDNKSLMVDMVATKRFQNNLGKHESLKGCTDPDKCGGQAWEPGLQEQYYKLDEFKKMSAKDALNFQMPDYTPYNDWKKKAMDAGIKMGYNVTMDSIHGGYKVTDTNGILVRDGLYGLYKSMFGENAGVTANYKTLAYVQRKGAIANGVSQGQSEEGAERSYLNSVISPTTKTIDRHQNHIQDLSDSMTEKQLSLEKQSKNQGLLPDQMDDLDALTQQKDRVAISQKALEVTGNSINYNADSTDLNTLRFRGDNATAYRLEEKDMQDLAITMSMRGAKHELTADPFALAQTQSNLSFRNSSMMADLNSQYKLQEMAIGHGYAMELHGKTVGAGVGAPNIDAHGNTIPTAYYPEGSTTIPNVDDKVINLRNNVAHTQRVIDDAKGTSQALIFDMFHQAQIAATNSSGKSSSAIQILNSTFGDGWSKITDPESLNKYLQSKGKSSDVIFNSLLDSLDGKKNTTADVSWAESFMHQNGQRIQDAKLLNLTATQVNKKERSNWKDTVNNIKGQSSINPIYNDADLLLAPNGDFITDPAKFKQRYEDAYNKSGITSGDSDKVYKTLKDKFFDTYNQNVKGWNQGPGLPTGSNTQSAATNQYQRLSANRPNDTGFIRANSLLNTLNEPSNKPFVKVGIGTGVQSDVDPKIAYLFDNILTDNTDSNKKGVKPIFTLDEKPMMGGDPNISGVTLHINNAEEYLKQFWGTPKNPSPLDQYKQQLLSGEGITLSYPNKQIKTPTTDAITAYNPLEELVKTSGWKLDSWPKAGSIEFHYNPSTGMVTPQGNIIKYEDATGKSYQAQHAFAAFPISEMKQKNDYYAKVLDMAQESNIQITEPYIRDRERQKLIAQQKSK